MGVARRLRCIVCEADINPLGKRRSLCSDECIQQRNRTLAKKQYNKQKAKGWPNRKRWLERHRDRQMLTYAKTSAWQKGLSCTIVADDITIPDKCPVLGIPLFFTKGRRTDNTPTLDRIDNNKGYIPENIVVVSWRVNNLKRDATISELTAIANFYSKMENSE